MKTKAILLLSIIFSTHLFAQDIEVKGLKTISESSVNAGARKDINGNVCGLVRVQLKEPDAQFSGNVLGDVAYKNGEYWVYMAMGSKRVDIKHPNYLPITVVFADYGVNKLASGAEYQMITKANKEKPKVESSKKGMAAIQVTPSNATLSIDGTPANPESGGLYTLNLPYGTHYYSVQYGNFAINNQVVKIDKTPKTVKVDLTDYFAKLSITCEETDASIYINDELKGVGSCDEMVIPDKYVIRVEKEGYHPLSQTVTLEDNEEFRHNFPKMKAIAGKLKVEVDPIGAEVYLDGKKVGVTPLQMAQVVPGSHQLEVKHNNCTSERRTIIITEDNELEVKGALQMPLGILLRNEARKGDACAMTILGYHASHLFESIEGELAEGPCETCFEKFSQIARDDDMEDVSFDDDKEAIEWFKRALNTGFRHKTKFGKCSVMLALSLCYSELNKYDEAFRWANKCVEDYSGNKAEPYYILAWFYCHGKGVAKDLTKAKALLQKANSKEPYSQYEVTDIYDDFFNKYWKDYEVLSVD